LIKFGSRVDVVFSPDAHVAVKVGDHVKGGSTILATLPTSTTNTVLTGVQQERSQS
jgi:phosphatidylserine decarboxylase